jgi:hypothetical protein
MKSFFFLLIPGLILFSSAKIEVPECDQMNSLCISISDKPYINYCISDSFIIEKKEAINDTIFQFYKDQPLMFGMWSVDSNVKQQVYCTLKDKSNGKIIRGKFTFIAYPKSPLTYGWSEIWLDKLHSKSITSADFSIMLFKISNQGKDTLRCDLGDIHLDYDWKKNNANGKF